MTQTPTPHAPTPHAAPAVKHLTRSRTNRQVAGVCGGIASYTGVDVTIVRLGVALVTVFTWGLGAVAYLFAAIIMPEEPAAEAASTAPTYAPPAYSTPPTEPTIPVTVPPATTTEDPSPAEPTTDHTPEPTDKPTTTEAKPTDAT